MIGLCAANAHEAPRADRRFRLATESRVVTLRRRSAVVQYVRLPGPAR